MLRAVICDTGRGHAERQIHEEFLRAAHSMMRDRETYLEIRLKQEKWIMERVVKQTKQVPVGGGGGGGGGRKTADSLMAPAKTHCSSAYVPPSSKMCLTWTAG